MDTRQQLIELGQRLATIEREKQRLCKDLDAEGDKIVEQMAAIAAGKDHPKKAPVALNGHAAKRSGGETNADKAYSIIASKIGASATYAMLSQGIYGEDTVANRAKCRSLVYWLKQNGRIRDGANGSWEVIEK